MAELLLGTPIFPGNNDVDQMVQIIKILGTPSKEQILSLNPKYSDFKFPAIKQVPWSKVSCSLESRKQASRHTCLLFFYLRIVLGFPCENPRAGR